MGYIDCEKALKVGASVQRYFVPQENWAENEVTITGSDAHHIIRVMRFKEDDNIICNHPDGTAYLATITQIEASQVTARLEEPLQANAELPITVTILQGLPKGNKLEWIIQKGTELGASRFLFFAGDRSVTKWHEKKVEQKLARYRKIVKEASEQCHRNIVPTVAYVGSLDTFLAEHADATSMNLFAYEVFATEQREASFAKQLQALKAGDHLLICVGPEGGFSQREVELLLQHRFSPIRLGKRILRTETASLYALASISYHFEELEC